MVQTLLSETRKDSVHVDFYFGPSLNELALVQNVTAAITSQKYSHVVMQGAMLSTSHKYNYSQSGAHRLARACHRAGSDAIFFTEWPREGIKEAEYIYNVYRGITDEAGGRIAPVCFAFEHAMRSSSLFALWDQDGNHAELQGAYLAACVLAKTLGGRALPLSWSPKGVSPSVAEKLATVSEAAFQDLIAREGSMGTLHDVAFGR
ncbi:hypothetical protein QPK87_18255 [Kamptonema cortianum]|nr:hypothetical protein [Geitlerinema splendidum]MDK3158500.1 hypothetical protein [Kamptonema cortianum]